MEDLAHQPRQRGITNEVFPLKRAVTFSGVQVRLGLAIMVEDGLQPNTSGYCASMVQEWPKVES